MPRDYSKDNVISLWKKKLIFEMEMNDSLLTARINIFAAIVRILYGMQNSNLVPRRPTDAYII